MKRRYEDIRKKIVKLTNTINKLKKDLKESCDHPKFSRDKGYGDRGREFIYYICLKCGKYFEFKENQQEFDNKIEKYRYFSEGIYQ